MFFLIRIFIYKNVRGARVLVKLVFNTTKISLIINGVRIVRMLKICSLFVWNCCCRFFLLRNFFFSTSHVFVYVVRTKTCMYCSLSAVDSCGFDLSVWFCQCCGMLNENRHRLWVCACIKCLLVDVLSYSIVEIYLYLFSAQNMKCQLRTNCGSCTTSCSWMDYFDIFRWFHNDCLCFRCCRTN